MGNRTLWLIPFGPVVALLTLIKWNLVLIQPLLMSTFRRPKGEKLWESHRFVARSWFRQVLVLKLVIVAPFKPIASTNCSTYWVLAENKVRKLWPILSPCSTFQACILYQHFWVGVGDAQLDEPSLSQLETTIPTVGHLLAEHHRWISMVFQLLVGHWTTTSVPKKTEKKKKLFKGNSEVLPLLFGKINGNQW